MPIINEQTMIDMDLDATTLEKFVNSTDLTVLARLGLTLDTLQGHLVSMGYKVPVAYTSGLSITLATQTVEEVNIVYAPIPSKLPIDPTPASFVAADWYPVQTPAVRVLLSDYSDFADALSTVGGNGTIVIDENETLAASTYTVPPGVIIITKATFKLTLASGTTLNVNGSVVGVDQWIVNTVGTLVFNNQDIDIRWLGAVDGSDSNLQIRQAIVAALTNKLTVYIPKGTWKIASQMLCNDQVNIRGDNFNDSILQASANLTSILFISNTHLNGVISNLQFDINSFDVTRGINHRGGGWTFRKVKVKNTAGTAPGDNVVSTAPIGLDINSSVTDDMERTLIEECEFHDLGVCIGLDNGPKDVVIRNCKFTLFGRGGIIGKGQTRITDGTQIKNNYFADPLGGGSEAKFAVSLQALAFTYSNTVCSGNMVIGKNLPYRIPATLQATDPSSFPAATKNDYVFFTASATVDGQAVLAGENWICITTTGGGNAAHWQLTKKSLADGFEFETVDGLIVEFNYIFGSGGSAIALRDDCNNVIVEGNHIVSADVNGIEAGTGSTTGNDVFIANNFMHNCARDQAANNTTHGALFLKDLDDSVVVDNKISCDITSSEQMPYAIVIEDCLLLTERDNHAAGWATSKLNISGTNTFTGEQTGIATSGDINWDAGTGFEVTLSDGTGVLKLPTGIRPGLEPTLRFFSGEALDVTAFTIQGGSMYNPIVAGGTLNTAKIRFDNAGVGYLKWDNGVIFLTNAQRPTASAQADGAFFFNTNDNEFNVNDAGTWRDMDGNST